MARVGWFVLLTLALVQPIRSSAQTGTTPLREPSTIAPQTPWQPPASGVEPAFEVATVKPSDPDKCCARTFGRNGRHFATTNTNLKYLIQWAWNLQAKQVVGGPAWMDVDRFDLAGEMNGTGTPNGHEWKEAVQRLLLDRFRIQMHHEKLEMTAFALVVDKGGPKLTAGDGNVAAHQSMGFSGDVGHTMYGNGTNASIGDFIGELQRIVLDRPIVDQTGLTGMYNIHFEFTREEPNALGMTQIPDTAAPNLFDALKQQLGLKLEGTKAPVDVIVIDHAEPPGDN
ncbi:MAG TPA: TIGR03435 family protein [Acidobacteriaceae bacterium]|nr:TIGR03435 family protein [Acidobacteriaceae bacterium]